MGKQSYPEFVEDIKEIPENHHISHSVGINSNITDNTIVENLLYEIRCLRRELEEYRNENYTKKL